MNPANSGSPPQPRTVGEMLEMARSFLLRKEVEEARLEADLLVEVKGLFVGIDAAENWESMFQTAGLFGRLAREVGEHMGYIYPVRAEQDVTNYLWEVRNLGNGTGAFR